jgi:formate dehydrogenase subunit gamma
MAIREIEKYSLPVRILHWVHTASFITLFLTGLGFFISTPWFPAYNSLSRLIHRAAAVIFIAAPVLYLIINPRAAGRGLKQAGTWGAADFGWFKVAPRYFLLGDDRDMPPQGLLNSGQKLWWAVTLISGFLFAVTGALMWFGVKTAPPAVLRGMQTIHDIAFIVTGCMFLLHVYLAVFHPGTTGALRSMTSGKVPAAYAQKHHRKWYEEVSGGKQEKPG